MKELKTRTSNEEGLERTTLQCDEVLENIRATNGHATKNILKRCQSLLDMSFVSTPSTPSSSYDELVPPMSNFNASLDFKPFASDNERLMTKAEMLQPFSCYNRSSPKTWQRLQLTSPQSFRFEMPS